MNWGPGDISSSRIEIRVLYIGDLSLAIFMPVPIISLLNWLKETPLSYHLQQHNATSSLLVSGRF